MYYSKNICSTNLNNKSGNKFQNMNSINIRSCKSKKLTLSKITFREIGYFKIEMTKI